MKHLIPTLVLITCTFWSTQIALAQTVSGSGAGIVSPPGPTSFSEYSIASRGANHRVWQHVTAAVGALGKVAYTTNFYTELASGMHYQDPQTGLWTESQELIEGFPGGGVARHGPIQVIFANDLATAGAIDAQTPAGRFQSHLLCLSYADSALQTNVIIAEVTNCQGEIIAPNQVLYPQAFSDGLDISVRYTFRKSGWEQDILINDPGTLPAPEAFGMDSASPTLMLQVITEFINPPTPVRTSQSAVAPGTVAPDEDVSWGALKLGPGQAMLLGNSPSAVPFPTAKRWYVTPDNRHLLIEEIPFTLFLKQILSTSQGASLDSRTKATRGLASLQDLPKLPPARTTARHMEYAAVREPERGVLIDYFTVLTTNNFTLQSDMTYYVSGPLTLSGTTICEGGVVIKFTNSPSAKLSLSGPLVCKAGQYRPIVMTSMNDNSVGATISGSTGNPTNYNGATYLEDNNNQTNTYQYLRLSYAGTGLKAAIFSNGVWHCQFVKCGTAVNSTSSSRVVLRNVLMSQCTNGVVTTGTLSAEHLTADQCTTLLSGSGSSGVLTNSLVTAVTAVTNVTLYNSVQLASGSGVYQTVGAASCYLADNSPYRNAGVTTIDPNLLAALRLRTTYPPIVYSNLAISVDTTLYPQAQRDTDTPDLGYHPDPLDYAFWGVRLTNATLRLQPGTAIATAASYGIALWSGSQLISQGAPTSLNHIARYNLVQEGSSPNWNGQGDSVVGNWYAGALTAVSCRFTDWSMPAQDGHHFSTISMNMTNAFSDCQFHGGTLYFGNPSVVFTNTLLERVNALFSDDNDYLAPNVRNCLFWRGQLSVDRLSTNIWTFRDNAFDQTVITQPDYGMDGAYNAYVTNASRLMPTNATDLLVTGFNWQSSWLGNYYLPTNSTLINRGSTNANLLALYHYTTQTNQVKETNTVVEIGFHYVAIDPGTGQPYDTNGDGVADYLSDPNGNGSVDSGEVGWNLTGDLGLKVIITRPRNGANPLP
jgi:hypothetical protein